MENKPPVTHELTTEQYECTLAGGLTDVTATAEAVIDIWPYVQELVKKQVVHPHVLREELVECVYRSYRNQQDHILLPTGDPNRFIVLLIDIAQKTLIGHYIQDLNKVYGLHSSP